MSRLAWVAVGWVLRGIILGQIGDFLTDFRDLSDYLSNGR